jgi:hypothetical protein
MKKIFLLLTTCLFMTSANAQNANFKFGEKLIFQKGMSFTKPFGFEKDKVYAFAQEPKMNYSIISVAVIDAKTMAVERIEPVIGKENTSVISGFVAQGQRWIFTRTVDKKTNTDAIEAYKFTKTGKIQDKAYPMKTFQDEKVRGFGESQENASVRVLFSPDSSKVGLFINTNLKHTDKETFYLKVFNTKDMSKVWEQTVATTYSEQRYTWFSVVMNNEGQIQCCATLLDIEGRLSVPTREKLGYKYVMNTFDSKSAKANEFPIILEGKRQMSCFIKVNPENGNTILSGFYADDYYHFSNGVFFIEIEKSTNQVVNSFKTPLPFDKIRNTTKAIFTKKQNTLWRESKISDIFVKTNGEIAFVIENAGGTPYKDLDIIVLNTGSKGSFKWATSIPRSIEDTDASSYGGLAFLHNDDVYILYNDHKENINVESAQKIKTVYRIKDIGILVAKINTNGDLNQKLLATHKETDDYLLATNYFLLANKKEIYCFIRTGDAYKMARANIME